MWPVPEGKGTSVHCREKCVRAKWRGVEKCSEIVSRRCGRGCGVMQAGIEMDWNMKKLRRRERRYVERVED